MSAPGQTALILGATGQVGGYLLKELLSSPHFTRVAEFGRRTTSLESLPAGSKDKLEQRKLDFENPDAAGLKNGKWDVVFITLGTTAKDAGSSAAFEKIDREYVINAARSAKSDHPQRLIYVSSGGADPSSRFLYARSKGLTEQGLASLGYSETIIFRPGLLTGVARPEPRIAETIGSAITGALSFISDGLEIKVATLAKSLVKAAVLGSSALPPAVKATKAGKADAPFTLISNAGSLALAKD